MNRLFGFFRDKISEAKEENQNQIQNLMTAFDVEPYSKQKMLSFMQEIKTNYLEWNIMIANEASTGLYFAQLHNKNCVQKKIKALKERSDKINKHEIVIDQMQRTIKELKSIDKLNKEWANDMNRKVEKLGNIIKKERTDSNLQEKQYAKEEDNTKEKKQDNNDEQIMEKNDEEAVKQEKEKKKIVYQEEKDDQDNEEEKKEKQIKEEKENEEQVERKNKEEKEEKEEKDEKEEKEEKEENEKKEETDEKEKKESEENDDKQGLENKEMKHEQEFDSEVIHEKKEEAL